MANRVEKKKDPATGTGLSGTKPKIAVVSTPDAVAKFNWLNPTNFFLSISISFIIIYYIQCVCCLFLVFAFGINDHIFLWKIVIASARGVSYWKLWTQTRNLGTQKQKLTLAVRQPSY